jgi:mRNA interferase MazF
MQQSEIWYADLDPTRGSEQQGFRPVVIISGNLMNEYLNTIICCPLTTKIKNYKGNIVLQPDNINKLKSPSEILTSHIRSVTKDRLVRKIGEIKNEDLAEIRTALNDMMRY